MSDRELLEWAANAHGRIATDGLGGCYDLEREKSWNPLTDDGDALRLAVKLGLRIYIYPGAEDCFTVVGGSRASVQELHGNDPAAATRLAIVRAAASIGQSQ